MICLRILKLWFKTVLQLEKITRRKQGLQDSSVFSLLPKLWYYNSSWRAELSIKRWNGQLPNCSNKWTNTLKMNYKSCSQPRYMAKEILRCATYHVRVKQKEVVSSIHYTYPVLLPYGFYHPCWYKTWSQKSDLSSSELGRLTPQSTPCWKLLTAVSNTKI